MAAHRSNRWIQACAVMAVTAAAGLFPMRAEADLIFDLSSTFNGVTPTSTPPWLTATFHTVAPGTVTLELDSTLNVASEFFGELAFNVPPTILPSSLSFTPFASNTGFANPTVLATTNNAQNLTGGGSQAFGFDVMFDFASGPPASRFNGTDVAQYTITGSGLTENDFNFTNSGDDLPIAAHIQGIPCAIGPDCTEGTTSGAVTVGEEPVPEPSPLSIMGTILLGLGLIRWRRKLT